MLMTKKFRHASKWIHCIPSVENYTLWMVAGGGLWFTTDYKLFKKKYIIDIQSR